MGAFSCHQQAIDIGERSRSQAVEISRRTRRRHTFSPSTKLHQYMTDSLPRAAPSVQLHTARSGTSIASNEEMQRGKSFEMSHVILALRSVDGFKYGIEFQSGCLKVTLKRTCISPPPSAITTINSPGLPKTRTNTWTHRRTWTTVQLC